jgi:hypothetical protein
MSLEKVEVAGGAAVLGVPAFEAFVWLLDNFARFDLLMSLQDRLPHLMVNPVTTFACMCIGLWLLLDAHKRQMRRVVSIAQSGLWDSSGERLVKLEKPTWIRAVAIVFAVAFVLAPIVALAYTLAYRGSTPTSHPLTPPLFAYEKPPLPPTHSSSAQTPHTVVNAPGGIPIIGNTGTVVNPTVNNNYAPDTEQDRHIPDANKAALIAYLAQTHGKIMFSAMLNNAKANAFAAEWRELFLASGWDLVAKGRIFPIIQGERPFAGAMVGYHGNTVPNGIRMAPPAGLPTIVVTAVHSVPDSANVMINPSPDMPEGEIDLQIGPAVLPR